jgi:hypothetical protein
MRDILEIIPKEISVAAYVRDHEALRIYSGPIENVKESIEQINLEPFIKRGLLLIADIENEAEANVYINLAARLDDGEAVTGAIALNRDWALATDDAATRRLFQSEAPDVRLLSALELVKYWVDACKPDESIIRTALLNIRMRGRYEPPRNHHLIDWWRKYREE